MNQSTVLAILAMAAATYATRVSGLLIGAWLPTSGPAKRALDALPPAVLTAVVAPAVLSGRAELVAGAVTALAATRLPILASLALGMACVALLRQMP